jgi:hypothetical protein
MYISPSVAYAVATYPYKTMYFLRNCYTEAKPCSRNFYVFFIIITTTTIIVIIIIIIIIIINTVIIIVKKKLRLENYHLGAV